MIHKCTTVRNVYSFFKASWTLISALVCCRSHFAWECTIGMLAAKSPFIWLSWFRSFLFEWKGLCNYHRSERLWTTKENVQIKKKNLGGKKRKLVFCGFYFFILSTTFLDEWFRVLFDQEFRSYWRDFFIISIRGDMVYLIDLLTSSDPYHPWTIKDNKKTRLNYQMSFLNSI